MKYLGIFNIDSLGEKISLIIVSLAKEVIQLNRAILSV